MMAMDSALQIHPEVADLHAKIYVLRDELALAVAGYDELRHTSIPYLEAVYQQALGPAQLAALQAQIVAQRAKRLVELAMQAVNRGQSAPPLTDLSTQVEHELAAWRAHIADLADDVQQATRALSKTLSATDTAELKRVYHGLTRRLHPDANPDQDERARQQWYQVQEAYRDGDLKRLRVLAEAVAADQPLPVALSSLDVLRAQHQRLQDAILAIVAATFALQQRPPLSIRSELVDPTWVAARIGEFQTQEASWREATARWQAKLDALYPTPDPIWN